MDSEEPLNDDAMSRLFKAAGPRKAPSDAMRERVYAQVLDAWTALPEAAPARTLRAPYALVAAVLCAALLGVLGWFALPMLSGAEAAGTLTYSSNPHEIGQPVRIGQTVSTRHDSFAKITLQNRVSVSLGPSTRVVVHDAALLSLTQGRIYVDAGHGQIRLLTPHVQVVDIGTIYQVVSNDAQTTVTMREGEVQLVFDRNHHRLAARDGYGDFVAISAAGEIVEDGRLSTTDTSWSWQQAARAPLKLDRLPVLDYVQWLARDSGISLRFASNAVQQQAQLEQLRAPPASTTDNYAKEDALRTTNFKLVQLSPHSWVLDFRD